MDADPEKKLREDLDKLSRLKLELEEQDTLIMEYGRRSPDSAVGESQITLLEAIFEEVNALRQGLLVPFKRTDDPYNLRPQIRSARARVDEQIKMIERALGESTKPKLGETTPPANPRRVFVIHGRNGEAREAIFAFLSRINLDPIEWEEAIAMTGNASPSNLTAIERAFSNAQAAVVLLTGDDLTRLGKRYLTPHDEPHERVFARQARPNVIFEAGLAFGYYPTRTVIVSFGKTRPISDIDGINILYLSDTPESRQKLAGRLKSTGCDVVTDNKSDWLKAGNFASAYHDDPDHLATDKHAGLRITDRRYSPQENATYKPKVWVELRNDNDFCVEIDHLGWTESKNGIQIKTSFRSMQLKMGKHWCPKDEGVESLFVPPSSLFQMWIQPAEKHTEHDLKERCKRDGAIGFLDLRVDGRIIKVEV